MNTKFDYSKVENLTPMEAIKAYCLDCMCGSAYEVKLCPCTYCPLYRYRTGKTGRTRVMSEEQKRAATERLKKAREAKKSN